jgi:NAD+--dinitrogen-reductase ADP-D-ribosyltransferase
MPAQEPDPRTWYATNLVGIPAWVLASTDFNQHPQALHIVGTREAHSGLFRLLQTSADPPEAAEIFMHYMSLSFGLQPQEASPSSGPSEARRWRSSYIKLLQGWGADSNGPAGAVLKGWVESRFGIVPCYHKGLLGRFPSPGWVGYIEEKASSRFHNNCIHQQLDLLYEFCQWALQRFRPLGSGERVPLWRGVTRTDEQIVPSVHQEVVPRQGARQWTVRLNNLVSFALTAEQADCFGDWLLRAQVPMSKILFYPGLLPSVMLQGEGEVLAIGGDYEVEARYA